jgi:hypothetical protein
MDTKAWIKRIEADDEHMEALGMQSAGVKRYKTLTKPALR